MRPAGSPQDLERRRHRAMDLLQKGHSPKEVAQWVGVDRRSVRRWKATFTKSGESALQAHPAPGRPSRLPPEQRKALEEELLKGSQAAGFPSDLWTCARVAQLIERHFGIAYHPDHVGRLLHALGWSPQKPERRARERNEERIEGWVKTVWPALKKKPNGREPGLPSSTNPGS